MMEIVSKIESNVREEVQLDTNGWAPEVAISGSLGLLLSVYLRTPTSLFHVCTSTSGQLWDARIAVDQDCSAHDFLESIGKSYQQNLAFPVTSQTFWLRTDSFENWATSNGEASDSRSSAIPRQILCTVKELQASRSLYLEISEGSSSANGRFLSQLAHVTRQFLAATSCGRTLRDLDLMCDLDRRDLQRWNQQTPSMIASTVHETFRQRVLQSPRSQAVESWDGGLTYLELDALSSRACSLLLQAGARPGDCIPLCFEKTIWTVVAMLGVLKSGCSFLLMDVSHPTSRLQTLSRQIKATIVLSSSAQKDRAISLVSRTIVVCASSLSAPAGNEPYEIGVSPSDVAVVVFTSGTTGTPKGIQLEHRSICSSLSALANLCGIARQTRYFQFSSYAFDAAFGEILMTLMRGGCVCIPSDADRMNNFAESIRNFNANAVLLTPTVVRLLSPSDVPCLTTLISGGEKVTQDIVGLWADKLDLIIVYGPAETTIACIGKKARPTGDDAVRIGFPVNSRAWVARLDDPNQLAPVGAIGELVAEGPGIARGYISNESSNAEVFLDSLPWAKAWESIVASTGRSYRTGDLVRYADDDGELIFVGRRDRQVKLRGQRIELDDVESKLKQHLRLPEANIFLEVLRVHGTSNLVAFLGHPSIHDIPRQDVEGDPTHMSEEMKQEINGLRARISDELPAYMCPVAWIPLREVPLGPTGKLDRGKLLSLGEQFYSRLRAGEQEDKGLSPVESVLARMWRQILPSAQSLTPDANFFQLGGDSLRCMKLVAMANQEGFHLTMEKVFKTPTLSGMTTAIRSVPAAADHADESNPRVVPASYSLAQDDPSELRSLLQEYGLDHQEVAGIFPCTGLQAGLFSLSLALPSLYSSQFVFDFSAAVDIQRFKAAWESAITAFPILRTAIVPSSSSLVQVVLGYRTECTEVRQDLESFLAADKAVSFQPGQPLSRRYLVQDPSSGQSHFVWMLHHAVFDGWSLEYVVDHIRHNYYSHTETVKPTGSFREFVQFGEGLDQDECISFWAEQLKNAPTPSFPNFPKAGHLAADRTRLRHTMAAPIVATTTTTVLARASWALLLSEYEGSDDVTFGNSLHGRNSLPPKLQDVVGPTITTLPIRVRIGRTQTVLGFLEGLQEQFSAMIPYEQFGLSRILGISQDIQNAASFRTLLIVQLANTKSLDEQGIRLDEVDRSLHEYPLVLTLIPWKSQIEIVATFDSDVISPPQVQRILEQFEQTFHELNTAPRDTRLGELDLASKADKLTMFGWNARPHKAYDVCVHELIRERVIHFRASAAIYSRDGTMDYATLDKLSDGLAVKMVRSGLEPGNTVGVLFEKSQWAIVSILAVIKAGSAFAPLSPTYPRARLEGIASDAGIKVVLCSPLQEEAFPNPPWRTIVVSGDTAYSFTPAALVHGKVATPDSLLYILSTSGTTGSPKIFGVQHKSFATGAMARAPLLKRGPDSRVLQFAPYAFDPSVEDILTTLMFGGCICVPSDEDIMGDISAFMKTARVNFANITPSVAYTLKEDELPDLQILLLSGEAPDQPLVDKWDGIVQLMNGYGPSECSVKCAINCNLSRNDPRNIGHSAGTSLWVVRPENHNRLTPLGAVGELVIESPHLATGYMNRPEANEEKFILSPPWLRDFRDGHIAQVYRTGDLVRYMEDGSILYIGRADMQLKLHGQRLEGDEVRQRIQESLFDAQLQVIVDIARFEGQDSDVLVAYLAQKGEYRGGEMDIDHVLQQHLTDMKEHIIRQISTALPKYMIPTVFLAVTNIPITANGKSDRRALRAYIARQRLGPHLLLSGETTVQPLASETEKLLHRLWQKLLGLNGAKFGANSNFFELGGSSLAAIKLASAARDLGLNLSAQMIFKNPVLSAMAARMVPLKETRTSGPSRFSLLGKIDRSVDQLRKSLVAHNIDEQAVEDAYPLTSQQQRYMEGEMISPGGTTHRHIMQLPANIDLVRLETALRRVVLANALLRTRIISVLSQFVQVVLKEDFACRHVEALSSLVSEDRKVSWGLGQPLSRFSIVHAGYSQDRWLAWSSAHVIFDGWCRKLLLEDIDYAYHHNDNPPERPQYNRFIEYVYELGKDEDVSALVRELEATRFWSYFTLDGTKVPGITHNLTLCIDFPATLPAELSYPTVMLTAWAIAAAHVEEHDHFLFNILLGGRDAEFTGIDRLMGPVSTTAPLATRINRDSTFRKNVEFVQKRIDQAGSVKHLVRLGDKLHRLLSSAPVVVVHPADDYAEVATKHLGLFRSRVETVRRFADAMFMNFCLRPGNTGVDLVMTIDSSFFPEDKAVRSLGYLEQVLMRIFTPGGLDLIIGEMNLGSGAPRSPVSINSKIV
ncbi:putative nonribosomal peptide synthase [Aspergillus fischeri NRRL 181]|uniref:Nonribosomal peptide synthase, putative n=1 Tax=Neosartorya fischeri (strain ATCC 1020 / DSM 3700 / CBS 544.65 / FGSC A1164 / JCM 1740 / NRRL 181 / WB 181) TaxID=331117 RepID=A1DC04_NEOFI|nr:nonribosomal peptide synthase, putative [Aspergillus fischeri NRRL 181]EAW20394.1 nonribosomal peptide synthase, putative [Aspergillus fischeri NRRL 181]